MTALQIRAPFASLAIKPYRYCVVDLETRNCAADVIARVVAKKMAEWEPPSNYKDPDKIARLRAEVEAKAGGKSATWDEAPIGTIGVKSDSEFRLLHCLRVEAPRLVGGATAQGFASEADMLRAFSALVCAAWILPDNSDRSATSLAPTEIVGHNVLGFDLPKLRLRSLVQGIALPGGLVADLPVYDTMRKWGRFSHDQRPFVPASDVFDALGIAHHKPLMSGADVPDAIDAGRHDEVIAYALNDLIDIERAYLMMTGQYPGK